jgi:hypothetical protein
VLGEIIDALFFQPDFANPGKTLRRLEKRLGQLHSLTVHCQHRLPDGSWVLVQATFEGDRDTHGYAVHTIVEKRGGTLGDGEFAWNWAHKAAGERGTESRMEEHFMASARSGAGIEEFERQLADLEQFSGRRVTSLGLYSTADDRGLDDYFILKAYLLPLPGATNPALSTIAAFDLDRQEELRALATQLAAGRGIPVQES